MNESINNRQVGGQSDFSQQHCDGEHFLTAADLLFPTARESGAADDF